MQVKVLVFSLMCIAVAIAVPLEADESKTHLTLAELENENQAFALNADENPQDGARSKRFLLKKLALLKAGALGVGYALIPLNWASGYFFSWLAVCH